MTAAGRIALLDGAALLADDGMWDAARFVAKVACRSDARKRVIAMRSAMYRNAAHLQACALVAELRQDGCRSTTKGPPEAP